MSTIINLRRQGQEPTTTSWLLLGAIILTIIAVFAGRTYLTRTGNPPRLSDLFETFIVLAAATVLLAGFRRLTPVDWLVALGLGLLVGLQLPVATLFSLYPYFDAVHNAWLQAIIRGSFTAVAALGGLVLMRSGGPVPVRLAICERRRAIVAFVFGALVGAPLAVLNAFANAWVQGRPFVWQSMLAAAGDALQPALVEEIIYRLAFLGLLWLVLQRAWSERPAVWLAGILSLLVHTYGAHYSDEFLTQPLPTLIMGALMGLIWGLPLTGMALRRDLETATGFHWVQDFARFWAGF